MEGDSIRARDTAPGQPGADVQESDPEFDPSDTAIGPPPPLAGKPAWSAIREPLTVPLIAGVAVAVALGVYGRIHQPGGVALNLAGFSNAGYAKTWLTCLAMLLGIVQIATSFSIRKQTDRPIRPWTSVVHRWSGRLCVLATMPVLVHCLYALGFEYDRSRVLLHSVVGCLFYGAFVTKMLALPRRTAPNWTMPVVGGFLFAMLVLLWLTSALWLFADQGVHL